MAVAMAEGRRLEVHFRLPSRAEIFGSTSALGKGLTEATQVKASWMSSGVLEAEILFKTMVVKTFSLGRLLTSFTKLRSMMCGFQASSSEPR